MWCWSTPCPSATPSAASVSVPWSRRTRRSGTRWWSSARHASVPRWSVRLLPRHRWMPARITCATPTMSTWNAVSAWSTGWTAYRASIRPSRWEHSIRWQNFRWTIPTSSVPGASPSSNTRNRPSSWRLLPVSIPRPAPDATRSASPTCWRKKTWFVRSSCYRRRWRRIRDGRLFK